MAVRSQQQAPGRHRAPAMAEHDRNGRLLTKPYPKARDHWRRALWLAGILVIAALFLAGVRGVGLLLAILAVPFMAITLSRRFCPTPQTAFLTLGHQPAYEVTARSWIRLRDGFAVEVMNVAYRAPDTIGDPTPPRVHLRCSDDVTREYRPHDALHVVTPVDVAN